MFMRSAPIALIAGLLAFPAAAVTVEQVQSPGGITAYLAQDRTNPIIAMSFRFEGGTALDSDAQLGLSSMATALLDEGAGDLDSFAFQSALEDRAISLRFDADRDSVRGSLSTTTQASADAFHYLKLALTQQRFDAEPIERIRRQILVKIKADSENPNRIASRALSAALFANHPYGRVDDGTAETVAGLKAEDFKAWAAGRFAKDRLLVAAAGDITPQQLGAALDQIFGALPAGTGLKVNVAEAAPPTKAQDIAIARDLPQSVISIGQRGIKRTDPDWYAAQVVDYIFGSGSFASRLMDEVREKRGLAYSVGSSLQPFDFGAVMVVGAGTRGDQADQSLSVIRDEFRKMKETGPTEEEVKDAKLYLTGAWPLRFTSTPRIAELLLAVQKDNLGLDYLDKRNSYIEAMTLADAKRVAAKLYAPDELTVVVVGPPKPKAVPNKPERERKSTGAR
ncbi:MAG: pitrilysin family protein [Rhodospirillaceae bacterium]|nr:pitrilysin family protein [Rhodospirillaceae bacterium]